ALRVVVDIADVARVAAAATAEEAIRNPAHRLNADAEPPEAVADTVDVDPHAHRARGDPGADRRVGQVDVGIARRDRVAAHVFDDHVVAGRDAQLGERELADRTGRPRTGSLADAVPDRTREQ